MKRWKRSLLIIVATVVTATMTVHAAEKTPQPIPVTPDSGTPAGIQVTPFDPKPSGKPPTVIPKALDAVKLQGLPSRPAEKQFTFHVPVKLENLYPNVTPEILCQVICIPYSINKTFISYPHQIPITKGAFSGIVTIAFDINDTWGFKNDDLSLLDRKKCEQWEYSCFIRFPFGADTCYPEVGRNAKLPECNVISGKNRAEGIFP